MFMNRNDQHRLHVSLYDMQIVHSPNEGKCYQFLGGRLSISKTIKTVYETEHDFLQLNFDM